jgi:Gpi18-like mannosyltransferase
MGIQMSGMQMTTTWWLVASAGCGFFLVFACWVGTRPATQGGADSRGGRWLFLLLIAALLARTALAATAKGYAADISTFSAWASHAAEGLTAFYSPGYFADYPPGYIYVLWLIGKLRILAGLDFGTPLFMVLLKLPAMLADCATAWLLYRLARRRKMPGAGAVALAALYAFNPAVILDSAIWGQVDSVLTFFILLGVQLLERRPAGAAASFAAALLIKPQALIFAPLPMLWFAVRALRGDRQVRADLLVFAGTAIVIFCLAIFPFAAQESPGWIIGKYGATLASYPYASLNAYNLFALVGANYAPAGQPFLVLSYATWGNIFIVLSVLFSVWVAFAGKETSRFWYLATFLCASVFVLSAKMHERYLFPALALALGFYIVSRDRLGLLIFAGFSLTQFYNAAQVLSLSLREVYAVPVHDPLLITVSSVNLLLWALLVKIGVRHYLT